MRADIVEPVKQYAEGSISIEEAVNALRQVTPAPSESTDNPWGNEADEHEGEFTDLMSAAVIYDLTAEDLGHLRRALYAHPIGEAGAPAPAKEFDESTPSLLDQLSTEDDEEDDAIRPDYGEPITVAPPTVTGDEPPKAEKDAKAAIDTAVKKRQIRKHFPGGQDHDQTEHGNWSDGSDSTSSSGGSGATLEQQQGSSSAPASSGPAPTSPSNASAVAEESSRGGGRASRPKYLNDLTGQERVRERLGIMIDAARNRGEPLGHVMLSGPPGLGKTTIANAIANEMDANLKVVTGPALRNRQQLQDILLDMNDGDVLFIDEIHALPKAVEEVMLPLLEDGEIDAVIGEGADARILRVEAPKVTVIGATTNPEGVVKPLRDRFSAQEHLSYYSDEELSGLVTKTASKYGMDLPPEAAQALASRSRGTPRLANRELRWVKDYIDSGRASAPDLPTVNKVLSTYDVDPRGLRTEDRLVLGALKSSGGAGINSLAAQTGQDEATIASVIEPYLMRIGFIDRGPGGRTITQAGLMHLEQYGDGELKISKSMGMAIQPTFNAQIEITKADDRKNLVFGWANVAFTEDGQVEDRQGHSIDVEDLEGAAYNFAVKYRKTGDMHKGDGYGDLVESMVITQDKIEKGGFPPDMLGKWWVGFKVPDEDWDRVESGERSMFSIQGRARLEPI